MQDEVALESYRINLPYNDYTWRVCTEWVGEAVGHPIEHLPTTAVGMDAPYWDGQQQTNSLGKRPRDVESTVTHTCAPNSRNTARPVEQYPVAEAERRRRRDMSQASPLGSWDTKAQTNLWLAQQNNMMPTTPVERVDHDGAYQRSRFGHDSFGERLQKPVMNWGCPPGERERPVSLEQTGGFRHGPVALAAPYKLPEPAPQLPEAPVFRQERPETATFPQAKHANIAGVEPPMEYPCGKCRGAASVVRESVFNLEKLFESLLSGSLSEVIAQHRQSGLGHDQLPRVADVHRVIDLITEAGDLAKGILYDAPSYLKHVKREQPSQTTDNYNDPESKRQRREGGTLEVMEIQRRQSLDLRSAANFLAHAVVLPDPTTHIGSARRPSVGTASANDHLPPIKSQSPPAQASPDGYGSRLPAMKPPPTPGRGLPSPPGRSHPSPPSYSIPSPSSVLFPSSAVTSNPPTAVALPSILQPPSPTPSSLAGPNTAIQAHTAALQHEVSVKKYALQTLQGEHDKLLAALRRSQTRARALEEKQVASDLEINTLAEERVRLLTQVQELEQNIVELSKSRDEFRQAAVKGGAQYVKIVRMASQLEMKTGEERREWKRQLEENRATIEALLEAQSGEYSSSNTSDGAARRLATPFAAKSAAGPTEDLVVEVQRLRTRCADMEGTLEAIRSERRTFREAMATLDSTGERIFDSAAGLAEANSKPPTAYPLTSS